MRRTLAIVYILMLLCGLSGCGTMANCRGSNYLALGLPERPPIPFGGVMNDVRLVSPVFSEAFRQEIRSNSVYHNLGGAVVCAAVVLVDMPLSIGGDIVTLPWTTFWFIREKSNPSGMFNLQQAVEAHMAENAPVVVPGESPP